MTPIEKYYTIVYGFLSILAIAGLILSFFVKVEEDKKGKK